MVWLALEEKKIVHEPPRKYTEVLKKNMENINNGGKRKLKNLEHWALRAFDSWHQFKKYDTS